MIVNMHKAKSELSRLVERAQAGEEVVIARNGKPAVRLTPVDPPPRRTPKEILESFRALAPPPRPGKPEGWSETDEYLADKHLEAAWEDGRVTHVEREHWMNRLERFEVWPEELEAFVRSRTPQ